MLSLNQTFDDTRTIKVLVVPIGNNSLFDHHFQVVSNLRDVPFYELSRPQSSLARTQTPPFKYFSWSGDGNILFDFLRYDRVLIGPGDLDNFQSSKRVLMVMGLINYPELGDAAEHVEEELDYYCRRHSNIILKRLFVFNYNFDDSSAELPPSLLRGVAGDSTSLVIFPPDGLCGSSENDKLTTNDTDEEVRSMVDVHLQEVMSHAALKIILELEQQMADCDRARLQNRLPADLANGTRLDDLEDCLPTTSLPTSLFLAQQNALASMSSISGVSAGNNSSNQPSYQQQQKKQQYRKKPSGRIHKWMGDLSLQVCSPRDAIEHYSAAITECRATGETLWLAGALDGFASAVLLLLQLRKSFGKFSNANIAEILGKELRYIPFPLPAYMEVYLESIRGSLSNTADHGGTTHAKDGDGTKESADEGEGAHEKAFLLAELRAGEAAQIYSIHVAYAALEVECLLRLARMHEASPYAIEKEQRVLGYVNRAISVPGLNAQQQLECVLEGALIFHRLGEAMRRKYAFFLLLGALMSAETENFAVASALMRYACKEFGLSVQDGNFQYEPTPLQLTSPPARTTTLNLSPSSAFEEESGGDCIMCSEHLQGYVGLATGMNNFGSSSMEQKKSDDRFQNDKSANASWPEMTIALYAAGAVLTEEFGDAHATAEYSGAILDVLRQEEELHRERRLIWESCDPSSLLDFHFIDRAMEEFMKSRSTFLAPSDALAWHSSLPKFPSLRLSHASSVVGQSPLSQSTNRYTIADIKDYPRSVSELDQRNAPITSVGPNSRASFGAAGEQSSRSNKRDGNEATADLGNDEDYQTAKSVASPAVSEFVTTESNKPQSSQNNEFTEDSRLIFLDDGRRRLTLPKLPNKLSHFTKSADESPSEQYCDALRRFLWNNVESDMLICVVQQTQLLADLLNRRDSLGKGHANLDKETIRSFLSKFSSSDTLFLIEVLNAYHSIVRQRCYPVELQQLSLGMFDRISLFLRPYSAMKQSSPTQVNSNSLPIKVLSMNPLELYGCKRPIPITATEFDQLAIAERNFSYLQEYFLFERNSSSHEAHASKTTTPISNKKAESTTPLYYDPFAAMRAREKAQKEADLDIKPTFWAVGESCRVRLQLSNPLSLPVLVDKTVLVFEGSEHRVLPSTLNIPACTNCYEVDLGVIPLACGDLKLLGAQFFINNASYFVPVPKNQRRIKPESLDKRKVGGRISGYESNEDLRHRPSRASIAETTALSVVEAGSNFELITSCSQDYSIDQVESVNKRGAKDTSRNIHPSHTNSCSSCDNTGADVYVALDILPGETRSTRVTLHLNSTTAGHGYDNITSNSAETLPKLKQQSYDAKVSVRMVGPVYLKKSNEGLTSSVLQPLKRQTNKLLRRDEKLATIVDELDFSKWLRPTNIPDVDKNVLDINTKNLYDNNDDSKLCRIKDCSFKGGNISTPEIALEFDFSLNNNISYPSVDEHLLSKCKSHGYVLDVTIDVVEDQSIVSSKSQIKNETKEDEISSSASLLQCISALAHCNNTNDGDQNLHDFCHHLLKECYEQGVSEEGLRSLMGQRESCPNTSKRLPKIFCRRYVVRIHLRPCSGLFATNVKTIPHPLRCLKILHKSLERSALKQQLVYLLESHDKLRFPEERRKCKEGKLLEVLNNNAPSINVIDGNKIVAFEFHNGSNQHAIALGFTLDQLRNALQSYSDRNIAIARVPSIASNPIENSSSIEIPLCGIVDRKTPEREIFDSGTAQKRKESLTPPPFIRRLSPAHIVPKSPVRGSSPRNFELLKPLSHTKSSQNIMKHIEKLNESFIAAKETVERQHAEKQKDVLLYLQSAKEPLYLNDTDDFDSDDIQSPGISKEIPILSQSVENDTKNTEKSPSFLIDYDDLLKLHTGEDAFLIVPPGSTVNILGRYPTSSTSDNQIVNEIPILWGLLDTTTRNGNFRFGKALMSPNFTDLLPSSLKIGNSISHIGMGLSHPLLATLISREPYLKLAVNIQSRNASLCADDSVSSVATKQFHDIVVTSEITLSHFFDDKIFLKDRVEIELAIVICDFADSFKSTIRFTEQAKRDDIGGDNSAKNGTDKRSWILSGKPYSRHTIKTVAGTFQHNIKVCFPKPGSFSICAAISFPPETQQMRSAVAKEESQWWMTSDSLIRVTALSYDS